MVSEYQVQHAADALLKAYQDAERASEIVHPLIREAHAAQRHLQAVLQQLQPALIAFGADAKAVRKLLKLYEPEIQRMMQMLSAIDSLQRGNILPLWKTKSHLIEDTPMQQHQIHDCADVEKEITQLRESLQNSEQAYNDLREVLAWIVILGFAFPYDDTNGWQDFDNIDPLEGPTPNDF